MRIIEVFQSKTEDERRKAVTEILINLENKKVQYDESLQLYLDKKIEIV